MWNFPRIKGTIHIFMNRDGVNLTLTEECIIRSTHIDKIRYKNEQNLAWIVAKIVVPEQVYAACFNLMPTALQ